MFLSDSRFLPIAKGDFFPSSALRLSCFLLLYVSLPPLFLASSLLLNAGTPKGAYWLSCLSIGLLALFFRKDVTGKDCLLFLAVLISAHAAAYCFFDTSHDGMAYFQPAARRVAQGFNPVYNGFMDLGRPPDNWSHNATYFPKATMYFAASVISATGDFQSGKAYHLILFAASLFFVWDFARGKRPPQRCLWLTMALNPIVLQQWTTFLADGPLASLTLISLAYAAAFFERKTAPPGAHLCGILALALLYCVKTTGFAYASILIFCVVLNRFVSAYRDAKGRSAGRLMEAVKRSFFLSFSLGGRVLLLAALLGFQPYITNMLQHRHILYPAILPGDKNSLAVSPGFDDIAGRVYPSAHNRFTRLAYSIMSRPLLNADRPAQLKSPLSAPYADWEDFGFGFNMRAGGMGPLFFLLVLTVLAFRCFWRKETQGWIIFTLLLMLFIQPYAWQMRYAPFLWCLPLAALLSVPVKKEYFLLVPLALALANSGGVAAFCAGLQANRSIVTGEILSPHRGETVYLDESIFECESIFDRYGLKQKFINPEELIFYRTPSLALFTQNPEQGALNVFFEDDLPPLPDFPLPLPGNEAAFPWLLMSEGIVPMTDVSRVPPIERWRSYDNKVKFYMRVDGLDKKPRSDWLLTLKGMSYGTDALSVWVFVNNQTVGHWAAERGGNEATLRIPRRLLEESFADPSRLFTLMLRMPEMPYKSGADYPLGVELQEIYLRSELK